MIFTAPPTQARMLTLSKESAELNASLAWWTEGRAGQVRANRGDSPEKVAARRTKLTLVADTYPQPALDRFQPARS
jgi:hypothetical protein